MAENTPSDIRFPNGTTYVVLVETNQYSGNFERELAAFVFGAYDEDRYHGREQLAIFEDAADQQPELGEIQGKVTTVVHQEYGDVSNTIWFGENTREYNTVAVFFEEALTDTELELAFGRAVSFAFTKKDLVIKSIRQVEVEVEITTKTRVSKS